MVCAFDPRGHHRPSCPEVSDGILWRRGDDSCGGDGVLARLVERRTPDYILLYMTSVTRVRTPVRSTRNGFGFFPSQKKCCADSLSVCPTVTPSLGSTGSIFFLCVPTLLRHLAMGCLTRAHVCVWVPYTRRGVWRWAGMGGGQTQIILRKS